MRRITPILLTLCLTAVAGHTDDAPSTEGLVVVNAADVDLVEFQWTNRPIVVFADTPRDPAFVQQMQLLQNRSSELIDRDVVVITDTERSEPSDLRKKLRPRGFMLVLIGKDGGVKLRKPFPWDVREISRTIDKMPMRRQEIRDRNLNVSQ
ncbi:MAG: DUF4174 domain-containing protein [Pseudomonadota bacterium]